MTTKKDWILFMLTIALIVFLAIAIFFILTDTRGLEYPNHRGNPQEPMMPLLRTLF
jgi:hypothetical protein